MKKESGFSFIELIVVVTIILVLTVAGTVSYQGASRRSRDSRRISDLQKIAISLEVMKQDLGSTYPDASGNPAMPSGIDTGGYIQVLPTDPKSTFSYLYASPDDYTYYLYAQMEDVGSTNYSGTEMCGDSECNYRLSSP